MLVAARKANSAIVGTRQGLLEPAGVGKVSDGEEIPGPGGDPEEFEEMRSSRKEVVKAERNLRSGFNIVRAEDSRAKIRESSEHDAACDVERVLEFIVVVEQPRIQKDILEASMRGNLSGESTGGLAFNGLSWGNFNEEIRFGGKLAGSTSDEKHFRRKKDWTEDE